MPAPAETRARQGSLDNCRRQIYVGQFKDFVVSRNWKVSER